jgi:hypothetical protein
MPIPIIVTDVTYMDGGSFCVAGWCEPENRMVRPLRPRGEHWPVEAIHPDGLWPGNVVEIVPSSVRTTRGKPHSYEDVIIQGTPRLVGRVEHTALGSRLEPSESPSVDGLFQQQLRDHRWVQAGAECPSLGAVRIATGSPWFYANNFGKLRCSFTDPAGGQYDFAVSAKIIRDAWENGGAETVRALHGGAAALHLRIGLAHPWNNNGDWPEYRAFAMVNGLFPCYE